MARIRRGNKNFISPHRLVIASLARSKAKGFASRSLAIINPGIFKAYDIRGVYPKDINENVVFEITKALGHFFKKGKIVVAYDARLSSPVLYRTAMRGLRVKNKKIKIIEVGFATTSMFYFLVGKLKAKGGVMVTASHNPKEYNGLKVVDRRVQMISGKKVFELMRV